jgi:ATP-dependent helicase/nuclease subunit B
MDEQKKNIPFLEKVAQLSISENGKNLENVAFVLPSQRAGLFLKKYLSKIAGQNIWAPQIFTVNDFVNKHSAIKLAEPLVLLFNLYEVYKKVLSENAENFENFIKWGSIMIADFNEIDASLAHKNIFRDLKNLKEIENYSLLSDELTENQSQYISFWNDMIIIYENYNKYLSDLQIGYQGKITKDVAENAELYFKNSELTKIYFVGFNALSKAEEKIILFLTGNNKASILWDTDAYYMNDSMAEAGAIINKYKSVFPAPFTWEGNKLSSQKKQINLYACAQSLSQVRLAGKLVKDIKDNQKTGNTAIVLADENLLEPLLNSLPDDLININITMGLPLKNSMVCNLYRSIIDFLKSTQTIEGSENVKIQYYYKDVELVLKNPILNAKNSWNACIEKGLAFLKSENYIYVNYKNIKPFFEKEIGLDALFELIFGMKHNLNNQSISDSFFGVNENIMNNCSLHLHSEIEKNALIVYSKLFSTIKDYDQLNEYLKNEKVFSQILRQLESKEKINFLGEPLEGLQIMGMLETRALDFENLILLSANEGILPKESTENSLIPQELKKLYGLAGYKERESIFAYYFYRLLQFSEYSFITYNTEADDLNTGEESRYIKQLKLEAKSKNSNIEINEYQIEIPIVFDPLKNPVIAKTDPVQKKLKEIFKNGISPSALNTFINCPLDFYYKYVLAIKESEEFKATIEANKMGTAIHEVLEKIYLEIKEKDKYNIDEITKASVKVEQLLKDNYQKKNSISSGKNHLIFNVSLKFIQSFLKEDKNRLMEAKKLGIEPKILFIEKKLETNINLEFDGEMIPVKLKGTADRIELWGNTTKIIDYKTGSVDESKLSAIKLDKLIVNSDFSKALQLYAYAYLYTKSTGIDKVESGIFCFKSPTKGIMNLEIEKDSHLINTEHYEAFEEIFKTLIQKIWELNEPFKHNPGSKYCTLCQ